MRRVFESRCCLLVIVLVGLLLVEGCRSFRLERKGAGYQLGDRLEVGRLLTAPFGHECSIAAFRSELPTVRPTRMLFQPSHLRSDKDTLYEFSLPEDSKIILYKSAKGQERFLAATIATPSYPLLGDIRTGMLLDTLRSRIVDLPDFTGDTLRLVRDPHPYEVDFYFKRGVLERYQVLGRKRLP